MAAGNARGGFPRRSRLDGLIRRTRALRLLDRPVCAVAVIALVPAVLIAIASAHGPGVSPDSVTYASSARNFAASGEIAGWDGRPVTLWPPGMAIVLGLAVHMGLDLQVAAVALNVVAAVASVWLTYALARIVLQSAWLAVAAAAVLAASYPLLHVYQMLWSEPLFCTFCLASVAGLARIAAEGPSPARVFGVALCVSVACFLRFIGIALIPVTGVTLLVASLDRGIARAAGIGVAGALLASAGAVAVVVRNVALGAPAYGERAASTYTPGKAISDSVSALGRYLGGADLTQPAARLFGLLVVAIVVAGTVALVGRGIAHKPAAPVALFVVVYVTLLCAIELSAPLERIGERYMLPIYAPAVVLVVAGVRALWRLPGIVAPWTSSRGGRSTIVSAGSAAVRVAVVALAATFVVANVPASVRTALEDGRAGVRYNAVSYRTSDLVTFAKAHHDSLLTNDPLLVYWISGHEPLVGHSILAPSRDGGAYLRDRVARGTLTYYVYFSASRTAQGLSEADLTASGIELRPASTYPDGEVFTLAVAAK